MGKLFGYPVFDETGEMVLTTYDNEYKEMMMDIRVYRMKEQEGRKFYRDGEEMAILLLSGEAIYEWEGKSGAASRKDVFTQGPWCLHVARQKEVVVTAKKETEILVQCTHNRPEGFGASFVGDQVFKSVDNSFSAIPGGELHPQAVAPGFQMYTCWMIRHLEGNPWLQTDRCEDERYIWLHENS